MKRSIIGRLVTLVALVVLATAGMAAAQVTPPATTPPATTPPATHTARDHTARDHTARDHTARDHTARDHTARDHTARDHTAHRWHSPRYGYHCRREICRYPRGTCGFDPQRQPASRCQLQSLLYLWGGLANLFRHPAYAHRRDRA